MAPPDKVKNGDGTNVHHHSAHEKDGEDGEDMARTCEGGHGSGSEAVDQDHKACDEHAMGGSSHTIAAIARCATQPLRSYCCSRWYGR